MLFNETPQIVAAPAGSAPPAESSEASSEALLFEKPPRSLQAMQPESGDPHTSVPEAPEATPDAALSEPNQTASMPPAPAAAAPAASPAAPSHTEHANDAPPDGEEQQPFALGSAFSWLTNAINMVEAATGIDIDGDGLIAGAPPPVPMPAASIAAPALAAPASLPPVDAPSDQAAPPADSAPVSPPAVLFERSSAPTAAAMRAGDALPVDGQPSAPTPEVTSGLFDRPGGAGGPLKRQASTAERSQLGRLLGDDQPMSAVAKAKAIATQAEAVAARSAAMAAEAEAKAEEVAKRATAISAKANAEAEAKAAAARTVTAAVEAGTLAPAHAVLAHTVMANASASDDEKYDIRVGVNPSGEINVYVDVDGASSSAAAAAEEAAAKEAAEAKAAKEAAAAKAAEEAAAKAAAKAKATEERAAAKAAKEEAARAAEAREAQEAAASKAAKEAAARAAAKAKAVEDAAAARAAEESAAKAAAEVKAALEAAAAKAAEAAAAAAAAEAQATADAAEAQAVADAAAAEAAEEEAAKAVAEAKAAEVAAAASTSQRSESDMPEAFEVRAAEEAALKAVAEAEVAEAEAAAAAKAASTSPRSEREVVAEIAELVEEGATCEELRAQGHSAGILRQAGFFLEDLKVAGFSAGELNDCGFTVKGLSRIGFSPADLLHGGIAAEKLATELRRDVGSSMEELEAAGFSKDALRAGGYDVPRTLFERLLEANQASLGMEEEEEAAVSQADEPKAAGPSTTVLSFEITDKVLGIGIRDDADGAVIERVKPDAQSGLLGVPVGGKIKSINGERAAVFKSALIAQLKSATRPTTLLIEAPAATFDTLLEANQAALGTSTDAVAAQGANEESSLPPRKLDFSASGGNPAPQGKYAKKLQTMKTTGPVKAAEDLQRFDVHFPADGSMGFGFSKDEEQGELVIMGVQPGSFAEDIGIMAGCQVVAVNGKSLTGMTHLEATTTLSNAVAKWPNGKQRATGDKGTRVVTFSGPASVASRVKLEEAKLKRAESIAKLEEAKLKREDSATSIPSARAAATAAPPPVEDQGPDPSDLAVAGVNFATQQPSSGSEEEKVVHVRPQQIIGDKPSHSWEAEWVEMCVEQAVLDGAKEYAHANLYEAGGPDSIEAAVGKHREAVDFKIASGWSPRLAQAHTLISACGLSAVARALRDGDDKYAASTHAICEALGSRAREMTAGGAKSDAIAPLAYCNLHGRFGLASEDQSWGRHLTPTARVGAHFTTNAIACGTANEKCFADGGGFGVPVMVRNVGVRFQTQDSPVVCFVSRPTTESKAKPDAANVFGGKKKAKQRTPLATGHSLIHSSGSSYELPPLATVVLEAIVPPGEWTVYGRKMQQKLFVVGVSYSVDFSNDDERTTSNEADDGTAVQKNLSKMRAAGQAATVASFMVKKQRAGAQLPSALMTIAVPFLVDKLKEDAELFSFVAEINECYGRFSKGELEREALIKALVRLVGMPKMINVAEAVNGR